MIEFEKRAMIEAEDKYTFRQSSQISGQTGLIGYLRADMDTDGNGFFSSWNDWRRDLKTDEFKAEFDEVINSLREEGDILHNRKALANYCYSTPQSKMKGEQDYYGVRVDTDKYAYLFRLNPNKGEYNLYCYCYVKDWLNGHMKNAEQGIRFINSHYKELFRISDGGKIKIHYAWNEDVERVCRYIVQGVISKIMATAGIGTVNQTILPDSIIQAIEDCGFWESVPLWAVTLIGSLFITVLSFIMIMTVYGRFFKIYLYTAIAPVPMSAFAGEPTSQIGKSFIKSYAATCLEGAIIVLACVIFSVFAASPLRLPVVDPNAEAVNQVWSYVGELIFNMLVLVGTIKMADHVVKEMTGV